MNFIDNFVPITIFYITLYMCLIGVIRTDSFISKDNKRTFVITILLCIVHLILCLVGSLVENNVGLVSVRAFASMLGYSIRPFIILYVMHLVMPKKRYIIWHILGVANMLLYITSPYTHLCVYFTENSVFKRGPLWPVIFILCACELIYISYASVVYHYKRNIRRWLLPPICSLIIVYAVYEDYKMMNPVYPSSLNKSLPFVMFLIYVFYHLQLVEHYQSELLQKQQLQLMISQIKPHFFFNTITTIQALCHIDPQKASDTLGVFASYIRQNLTMQTDIIIPFEQELKHLKAYVDIEILRFTNIEVNYDLQTTDFDIAAFSIQPIIENSIKHGIHSRSHGIITLHTQKTDKAIVITIEDNGIGFDVNLLDNLDNTHIGINNVRNRLKILQNATMKISSSCDGTTVTINIPLE